MGSMVGERPTVDCTRSDGMPGTESAEDSATSGGGELPPSPPPPYLISTPSEIASQHARFTEMKMGWLDTYPGWAATLEAKCQWLRKVEESWSELFDAADPIGDFFGATARMEVHVLLVVRSESFHLFKTVAMDDEEAPKGYTVVAKRIYERGERVDKAVPQLLADASLSCDAKVRQIEFDGVRFVDTLPIHVGECVHYGRRNSGDALHCAVALLVSAPGIGANQATMAKCLGIADELPMAVHKGSDENGGLGTIWIRDRDELQRAVRHLRDGYGEVDEVRRKIVEGGSEAGHMKIRMIKANLRYYERMAGTYKWRRRLSLLLALSLELDRDMTFIDTHVTPEDVPVLRVVMTTFASAWRSVLSRSSEHELGICPPGEDDGIASYSALISFLEMIKEKVEAVRLTDNEGRSAHIEFACLPKVKGVKRPAAHMPHDFYEADARYLPDFDLAGPHFTADASFPDKFSALGEFNGGEEMAAGGSTNTGTNPIAATVRASLDGTPGRKVGRPIGRPPMDSLGIAMEWDNGCWRSTYNKDEVRAPANNSSSTHPSIAGPSTQTTRNDGGGLAKRPKGRAPHDSKGEKMIWDEKAVLWRSASNPEEITKPKRKSIN